MLWPVVIKKRGWQNSYIVHVNKLKCNKYEIILPHCYQIKYKQQIKLSKNVTE